MRLRKLNDKTYMSEVLRLLKKKYSGQMQTSLHHETPWQLLVATILSAQAQDAQVNKITPALFRDLPNVKEYARIRPTALYKYIGSIGLFRSKAKSIVESAKIIMNEYHGSVPYTIDELLKLRGVGRKTANVVLSNAFGTNSGIAIDTHCITVANRLGIARTRNPVKIENRLMSIVPKHDWSNVSHLFIALGRDVCTARKKRCGECTLRNICPSSTAMKRRR